MTITITDMTRLLKITTSQVFSAMKVMKQVRNTQHKNAVFTMITGLMTTCLMLFSMPALASALLKDVRFNTKAVDSTSIELHLDQTITTEPGVRLLNNPERIDILLPSSTFDARLSRLTINKNGIDYMTAEQQGQDTRLTVFVSKPVTVSQQVDGKTAIILIDDKEKAAAVSAVPRYLNNIQHVDFRRGNKGEGRVLIYLKENAVVAEVKEKPGAVHIEFADTAIIDDLLYQLDVIDFSTVVDTIETFREGAKARFVVKTNSAFEFNYQQLDNIFTLTLAKSVKRTPGSKESKEYTGNRISLNFQDVPVRKVLQIIADYNGFNLVTSDSVIGNITLRLDDVPWDQALDLVLKIKGLDKRMDGNILMVAPGEEIAAREARELEAMKQVEELEPLYSEFIQINYAKAKDIAGLLKSEETSILSLRGAVTVDERTNTLLIKDTAGSIEAVRRAIETLDVPVRQVIIESRMVTVRDNISEDFGVRWGFSDQQNDDGISGTLDGAQAISDGVIPPISDRLNVNLPVTNPAGSIGFHIAKLADGTILDLELSALERENKGEIIASPRITTANQKKARIEQGTEIPFVQASSSGATSVTFKKAVLSLEVTPHVTPDDKIILDLIITQDTRGDIVPTPTGQAVAIDTQRIETQVLVENGETIVLGGIYQQQIINTVSKVPLFGDIPYVRRLFRNDSEFTEKKELLIFVTPKIVTDSF